MAKKAAKRKSSRKDPAGKLFYKIGEVCELTGTEPYVLRYWEAEFPFLSPPKNRSGQRIYKQGDIDLILRIKELLYDEGYTIAGARRKLEEELKKGKDAKPQATAAAAELAELKELKEKVKKVRDELQELLETLG
jgi:DNA-binding transcriptional MerR regulator